MIKRLLYFLFLISSVDLVFSQTVQSICTAPASVVELYKQDAYRLAVRRSYTSQLTYKDSVRIDPVLVNTYLKALLAVYNATALPARDTVCKYFPVHTLLSPDLNTLLIQADSSKSWMHDFKNYVFPTTNATINNLLSKHSFTQTNYNVFNGSDLVSFESDSSWNINSLANKFGSIPGVILAGSNAFSLDGWDLTDSINPNYTTLIYKMSWGDCISGCMYRRYWKFRIYNDCSVSYVGSYGSSALGLFAGLNKTSNNWNYELQVFPNPASEKIKINTGVSNIHGMDIEILSLSGEILYHGQFLGELNISFLNRGMYLLKVNDGEIQKVIKFIKE